MHSRNSSIRVRLLRSCTVELILPSAVLWGGERDFDKSCGYGGGISDTLPLIGRGKGCTNSPFYWDTRVTPATIFFGSTKHLPFEKISHALAW